MRRKIFFCFILICSTNKTVLSQDIFRLNTDTISSYDILFQEEEDSLMIDKKKKKKKIFSLGLKPKKDLYLDFCNLQFEEDFVRSN